MTTNPLKVNNYHYTVSDKQNCYTCKHNQTCESAVAGTTIKVDRYHSCDKIDVKDQYKNH